VEGLFLFWLFRLVAARRRGGGHRLLCICAT
jgi:hypothetical protein